MRKDLPPVGVGETLDINLVYKADDGTPIDLTGHTVEYLLREATSGEVIHTATGTTTAVGNIDVKVPDEVTATWTPGKKAYLVRLVFPGGDIRWMLHGLQPIEDGYSL